MTTRARVAFVATLTLAALLLSATPAQGAAIAQEQQEESEEQKRRRALDERADQMLGPKNDAESQRPFLYLFPTAVQYGIDDTRIGDDTTSEPVAVFVPAVLSLRMADERTHFYLIYEPQVERYGDRAELDHWNHSGALAVDYQITPRLSLGVGGSVLSTGDPTRAIAELPLVLDRGEYVSTRGYVSLGYRLSRRLFLDVAGDIGHLRYDALPGQPDVGIDELGKGAIAGLSYEVARGHTLGLRYAYVTSEALEDASELPEDLAVLLPLEDQHGVDLGWEYEAGRGLTISLAAGIARGDRTTWTGSATIEKEWRNLRLLADYRRLVGSFENLAPRLDGDGLVDIGQGLLPRRIGSAADIFGTTIEGRTDRIQIAGRLQLSLSSFGDAGPYLDGLTAGAGLKYRLTGRIQPYVQVDYITQGLSPEVGIRRARSRYAAGLVLVLGPSPDNAPLDVELERRRALLPYAGAKRPW